MKKFKFTLCSVDMGGCREKELGIVEAHNITEAIEKMAETFEDISKSTKMTQRSPQWRLVGFSYMQWIDIECLEEEKSQKGNDVQW